MARRRDQHGIDSQRRRRAEDGPDVGVVGDVLQHGHALGMAKHFIKRRKNRALEARKRPSGHLIAGKVAKLLSGSKKDHGIGPFARNAIDDRGVMGLPGFLDEQRQRPDPCIKGALDDAL